ncbi:MAG: glycosyltransferase family 39 protein, partial [Chloroflexota bacterium]
MSNRVSYALVVVLLLLAALLRFANLGTLPPGFSDAELDNIRIAETVRQGRVEAFYPVLGEGREGLYQGLVTIATGTGGGLIGYRILSIWLGMVTLALVYALGKRLFGALAGLAAVALLAVSMFPIILARSVTPETALPLFVTAVLLALAYSLAVSGEQPNIQSRTAAFAALGILLGLGFYLHPISFVVTLFSMLFIVSVVFTRRSMSRRTLSYTWFAVVIMIVIATPYVISSLQRPELAAAGRLIVNDPTKSLLDSFTSGLNGWFFVGDSNPAVNLPGRPLIDLVSGLFVIVGLVMALRGWRHSRYALILLALLFLIPPALLAPSSPNFLAFAPLLPLIALLFGLGVTTILGSLPRSSRSVAVIGLVLLLGFNVAWASRDMFTNWANLPEMQTAYNVRLGQLAHYIDQTAATTPTVICTANLNPQNNPVNLTNTQILALMMHREDVILRYADCGTALILTEGGSREQVILTEASGLVGVNPYLREWLDQGELINHDGLPQDAVIILDVADVLANRIGAFTTTAPVAFDLQTRGGGQQVIPPPVRFGGNIAFLGYDHTWASTYTPGDVVPVTTYWRVDGTVPADLRL